MGFGSHSHRDMEIFSYVLEGELAHKDSIGNGSSIKPGDVQLMSVGAGIVHSEFNASQSDMVHFLQIWIVPSQANLLPRYQQFSIDSLKKRGQLALILSPDGDEQSLVINQDVRVYVGEFDGNEAANLELPTGRYAYVQIVRGSVSLNGELLQGGDGAKIMDEANLKFNNGRGAEVLVFDLRPIIGVSRP
ncbi:quercetin 2,3-dioxygenase [Modicisalibacter luteus]|nr:quercetin 2,3-dioxygenase [Halomonas lutea]